MSRIYFHSEHGTAELRGSERAYCANLCGRLLVAALEPLDDYHVGRPHPLLALLPDDSYLRRLPAQAINPRVFTDSLRIYLTVGRDHALRYQDRIVSTFDAALNTALVLGNDAVKLAARLHGQCELHCYMEGPHRAWLADIMAQGRAIQLFRADQGWEAVIALLRSRDDGPVVCSYSVCEGFPDAGLVAHAGLWTPDPDPDYPDEPNWDRWYALPAAERWHLAMQALRQTPARGLELTPEDWAASYVGDGITGLDLRAWLDSLLVDTPT